MNCQSTREQIAHSLATGHVELTEEIAGHMQSCAGCRTYYAQQAALFRAMDSGLSAMVNESVPPSLLPRVRARLEETRTSSPWFNRLSPAAAILVIACLVALPLVRRSFRSGGVQVTVIPKGSENRAEARQPLGGQLGESAAPLVRRAQSPRHFARPSAARRLRQSDEVAVLVSAEESQGLLQLAAAVPRSPLWAQAMMHPAAPSASQIAPIEPVEIANLEVNPLSEESQ